MKGRVPRLLVTGFSPFPGAPINPTQELIERLSDTTWNGPACERRFEVFDVDYRALPERLTEIARTFAPDVALHFGLSKSARGFQLERVARNAHGNARADNAGFAPEDGLICAAPPLLPSRLPLQAIHDRLSGAKIPVGWSDDAGGYLCNALMTLSLAGACAPFAPKVSGFIHVPPVGERATMPFDDLVTGTMLIIDTTLVELEERRAGDEAAFA